VLLTPAVLPPGTTDSPEAISITRIPLEGDLRKWAREQIGLLVYRDEHGLSFDWTSPYSGKPDDVCNTECFGTSYLFRLLYLAIGKSFGKWARQVGRLAE